MSIKQISFSPELADAPEMKDINLTATSSTDLSEVNFFDDTTHSMEKDYLFDLKPVSFDTLPPQEGGDNNPGEDGTSGDYNPFDDKTVDNNEKDDSSSHGGGGLINFDDPSPTQVNLVPDTPDTTQIPEIPDSYSPPNDFMPPMETSVDSLMETSIETPMEQVGGGEEDDPRPIDDAIDENDRNFLSKFEEETTEDKILQDFSVGMEFDFDLDALQQELSQQMDLYWQKNLDITHIESKVDAYIKNYKSEEYETYRKMFIYIMSKTKTGYKIDINKKGEYLLHRGDVDKYDVRLVPPKYINLKIELPKLKKELENLEFQLHEMRLELIENVDKLLEDDLAEFRKKQKEYYNLKHQEEIYRQYYKKINNIEEDQVEMFLNLIKKKINTKNETVHIIETNFINVPKSFQENIQNNKTTSLELYNKVIDTVHKHSGQKMNKEQKSELSGLIKQYLKNSNVSNIVHTIEQYQKEMNKRINIIIDKKPVIETKKRK